VPPCEVRGRSLGRNEARPAHPRASRRDAHLSRRDGASQQAWREGGRHVRPSQQTRDRLVSGRRRAHAPARALLLLLPPPIGGRNASGEAAHGHGAQLQPPRLLPPATAIHPPSRGGGDALPPGRRSSNCGASGTAFTLCGDRHGRAVTAKAAMIFFVPACRKALFCPASLASHHPPPALAYSSCSGPSLSLGWLAGICALLAAAAFLLW
jgi:hypothetical protein